MKIIEVKDGSPIKGETEPMTEEQLQREYDFYIAESIIRMLQKEGKITECFCPDEMTQNCSVCLTSNCSV